MLLRGPLPPSVPKQKCHPDRSGGTCCSLESLTIFPENTTLSQSPGNRETRPPMPKNTVNDPITDQEVAFAHLVLSGTMNDRQAAEAVGLKPDTAAYTKAKPRVRDYMIEHRNAVSEKLVEQEAEGLRKLNLSRDQILTRLWELARLSHEVTRGTIAGQIKALTMIVAIEGLIPGRPPQTQPTAPPLKAEIYAAEWLRKQQHQPVGKQSADPVAGTKTSDAPPQVPHPEPSPEPANHTSFPHFDPPQPSVLNPFINPVKLNRVPDATGFAFDTFLDKNSSLKMSLYPEKGSPGRRRGGR
jgi:hypothetical protein